MLLEVVRSAGQCLTSGMREGARRISGQALWWAHVAGQFAIGLAIAALVGTGCLAWRLAQGPLPIPAIAREIERAVNAQGLGFRLEVRSAAIAWEGFRGGASAPVDIRLGGVRLLDAAGDVRAALPDAAATLSFRALLRGRLVPATIELRRPSVLAFRDTDGRLLLGYGQSGAPPTAPLGNAGEDFLSFFGELMEPVSERSSRAGIRRLRLVGGEFTIIDRALGRTWALEEPTVDIRRAPGGGLRADGTAVLKTGALHLPVRVTGHVSGAPMRFAGGLLLPALRPAELADVLPQLGPLAMLDAPVALGVTAVFNEAGRPLSLQAQLEASAGRFLLPGNAVLPFTSLHAVGESDGRTVRVSEATLRLPGPAGRATGPVIFARVEARQDGGPWSADLDLRAEAFELPDIARLWPAGVLPGAREFAARALARGLVREGRIQARVAFPDGLDAMPEFREAQAALKLDRPVIDLGPDRRVTLAEVALTAQATPDRLRLERMSLRLPDLSAPGAPGHAAPQVQLHGLLEKTAADWGGSVDLTLDRADLAELSAYWPRGFDKGERRWLTENLTAGTARNGNLRAELAARNGLANLDVTALSGTLEIQDATVHWLRPLPPVVGASGMVEFGLREIVVRAQGGRQQNPDGTRSRIEAREAIARFHGLDSRPGYLDLNVQTAGPLTEVMAVLRHPRLKLFERRRMDLNVRGGQAEARLVIGFPLWADLPIEELRIRADARVENGRLGDVVLGRDLDQARLNLAVDTETLKITGEARLAQVPVQLAVDMDFRSGPPMQVIERATITARPEAREIAGLGLDVGQVMDGPVGVAARFERYRNGQGSVFLTGDLRDVRMSLPAIDWVKPIGSPGLAEATLRLRGNQLQAVDSLRLEALELALRGRLVLGRESRLERAEITEGIFGGSRFSGDVRPPERAEAPWSIALRGPLLDLRPLFGPSGHVAGGAAPQRAAEPQATAAPAFLVDLRFDRVTMGENRNLQNIQARARTDAQGLLREGRITGATGPNGAFEATLTPRGEQRALRLVAQDGGSLLHTLDVAQPIQGGRLTVNASYGELRPGAPLVGVAELDNFVVRDAPAIGKILQAMTLVGLVEALSGPGLNFAKLIAPFTLTPDILVLNDARAFSATLGLTAKGRILRERTVLDLEGTIVPAYALNSLLGNIPVVGRIFSPEQGGGVFAATFRVLGPIEQAQVTMNPLAALTPGFLRGVFGLMDQAAPQHAPARPR